MAKDPTVEDIINTMTQEQKNTLYYYMKKALREKTRWNPPYAAIESFDENQQKVFYYLIGCALEKNFENDVLEIIKGDN